MTKKPSNSKSNPSGSVLNGWKREFSESSSDETIAINEYYPEKQTRKETGSDAEIESTTTEKPTNQKKESSQQQTADENNDDDLISFFKSMEHTARKFPPLLKIKIKRMILDIMCDAEEGLLINDQK